MESYKLIILTPEKEVLNENVQSLTCEDSSGRFQILAKHESEIIVTTPTISVIKDDKGNDKKLFTSTGLIKVDGSEVVFCADAAEWPQNIDVNRARRAEDRARKRLSENKDIDVKRAKLALMRAISRIDINK